MRAYVSRLYPGADIDCIDLEAVERDLLPRVQSEDIGHVYAAVVVAVRGLDNQWRDVLRTLREKWSNKVLPIVVAGPPRLECEAMNQRKANGYIDTDTMFDPIEERYQQHVLSALVS
jgi:hypothetical protein